LRLALKTFLHKFKNYLARLHWSKLKKESIASPLLMHPWFIPSAWTKQTSQFQRRKAQIEERKALSRLLS
jgi:hypothetical protein